MEFSRPPAVTGEQIGLNIKSCSSNYTTIHSLENSLYVACDKVYKSTDYGTTWTETNSGLLPLDYLCMFQSLNNYLYIGIHPRIYRINSSGSTWENVSVDSSRLFGLKSLYSDDKYLYVGGTFSLLKTDGQGSPITWDSVQIWTDQDTVSGICKSCGYLFAGAQSNPGGIYRIQDGKSETEDWQQIVNGLPPTRYILYITEDNNYLYTNLLDVGKYGIFKTPCSDNNWSKVGDGENYTISNILFDSGAGYLYIGTDKGIAKIKQ